MRSHWWCWQILQRGQCQPGEKYQLQNIVLKYPSAGMQGLQRSQCKWELFATHLGLFVKISSKSRWVHLDGLAKSSMSWCEKYQNIVFKFTYSLSSRWCWQALQRSQCQGELKLFSAPPSQLTPCCTHKQFVMRMHNELSILHNKGYIVLA